MAPNELQTGFLCRATIKRAVWPYSTCLWSEVWRGFTRLLIKGDIFKKGEKLQKNVFRFVFFVSS